MIFTIPDILLTDQKAIEQNATNIMSVNNFDAISKRLYDAARSTMIIDLDAGTKDVGTLRAAFTRDVASKWINALTFAVNVTSDVETKKSGTWTTDGTSILYDSKVYGDVVDVHFKSWLGRSRKPVKVKKEAGPVVSIVDHVAKAIWDHLRLQTFFHEKWDQYHVQGVRDRGKDFDVYVNPEDKKTWDRCRRGQNEAAIKESILSGPS